MSEADETSEGHPVRDGRCGRAWLVGATVVLVALAVRLAPLYWSPLPSTLDGILYAADAQRTLATGHLPVPVGWDELGFLAVLNAASAVSGVSPLWLAQSLTAFFGAAACLGGATVARRIALDLDWGARRVDRASLLAGLALALDGVFARRTGSPDEEVLGLLLVPVLALAVHYALSTRRPSWVGFAVLVALVLPPIHTLGALVAALTVTVVAVVDLRAGVTRGRAAVAVVLVGGFWFAVGAYYAFASWTPALELVYTDRILGSPGLFVSWVVVGAFGASLFVGTTPRRQRVGLGVPFVAVFALLAVNAVAPVFPGTIRTPPVVLALALALAVPAALAAWGVPVLARGRTRAVPVALLVGPLVLVAYALTADVTPDFFDTTIRSQTFVHPGVLLAAALAAAGLLRERPTAGDGGRETALPGWEGTAGVRATAREWRGPAVCVVLVLAVSVTLPLAFVELDTVALSPGTPQSEFAAADYASTHAGGEWTSEHPVVRINQGYYGRTSDAAVAPAGLGPTADWLRGGAPPACPTLARRSWTTTGANLFPLPAERLSPAAYERWRAERNVVYSVDGRGHLVLVVPRDPGPC